MAYVGGVEFQNLAIMWGAGVCKTPAATKKPLESVSVVSGSYTPNPRAQNGGKVLYPETEEEFYKLGYAVNSYGMPNMGFVQARVEIDKLKPKNPLIISIAGFSVEDYVQGYEFWKSSTSVKALELNLGCPNTESKIICFDLKMMEKIFEKISELSLDKPIWVKFSPYINEEEQPDYDMIYEVAKLVNDFRHVVSAVVTCNTVPNFNPGPGLITPNNGRGGKSGPAIRKISLGQLMAFRDVINSDIDIINVGGIVTGNNIVESLNKGAAGVQLTSMPFYCGNPRNFWDNLLDSDTGADLQGLLFSGII